MSDYYSESQAYESLLHSDGSSWCSDCQRDACICPELATTVGIYTHSSNQEQLDVNLHTFGIQFTPVGLDAAGQHENRLHLGPSEDYRQEDISSHGYYQPLSRPSQPSFVVTGVDGDVIDPLLENYTTNEVGIGNSSSTEDVHDFLDNHYQRNSQPPGLHNGSGHGPPTLLALSPNPLPTAADIEATQPQDGSHGHQDRAIDQHSEVSCRTAMTNLTATVRTPESRQCRICSKWLKNQDGLRRHLLTHENNFKSSGKHICPSCGRAFRHPKDLRRHDLKHTKDPFVCLHANCGREINRWDNACRHLKRIHGVDKTDAANFLKSVISRDPGDPTIQPSVAASSQVYDYSQGDGLHAQAGSFEAYNQSFFS